MIISYAQQFEDILLWRALKHVQDGFYIDIGASDPVSDSVSQLFHEQGWHGIHVEPNRKHVAALREKRPGDLVIEAAVADRASPAVLFFECVDSEAFGIGSISPEHVERISKAGFQTISYEVPVVTLDDIFAKADEKDIHWLKIDAENSERQIIESWRSEIFPWIVVVEAVEVLSRAPNYVPWEPLLLEKGYRFAWTDQVNRFYVHERHQDLAQSFQIGLSVFDEFVISPESHFCRASTNIARQERDQAVALHKQAVEQLQGIAGHLNEAATRQEGVVRQYNDMAEQYSALVGQHSSLLARHSELESGFHGIASERDVLKHQNAELMVRRAELSERHAALESVIDQERARHVELERRNAELSERHAVLESVIDQERARRVELERRNTKLLMREGELSEAINRLEARYDREQSQHAASKRRIADVTAQRDKFATQNEEQKAKIAEGVGQYNTLVLQNSDLRHRTAEMEAAIARQASELEGMRTLNRTLSNKLGEAERVRAALLVENNVLNAKTAQLSGDVAGRDQHIAALLGSQSWRVTKPLRLFMDGVRWCGRGAATVCGIRKAPPPKQRSAPQFKRQVIATKDFVKKHFPGLFQALKRNSLVMKLYQRRTAHPALDDWRNRMAAGPIAVHVLPAGASDHANDTTAFRPSASMHDNLYGKAPEARRNRAAQAGERWIVGARIGGSAEKTAGAFHPPASRWSAPHFTRAELVNRATAKWSGRTRIYGKQ